MNVVPRSISRRRLLGQIGAGALAVPFLRSVKAQAQTPPRRLVVIMTGSGTWLPSWRPSATSETSFTLSPILAPLERWKSRMVVIDGLTHAQKSTQWCGHAEGNCALLTGIPARCVKVTVDRYDGWGKGPSIDHLISKLPAFSQTVFPGQYQSLMAGSYSAVNRANAQWKHIAYRAANDPIYCEDNVYKLFDTVFRDFTGPAVSQAELDALRAERRSVLDYVRDDVAHLKTMVGGGDKARLDAHLQSLRELERSLQPGAPATAACKTVIPQRGAPIDLYYNNNFPVLADMHFRLMHAALACDRTRICVFNFSGGSGHTSYGWVPGNGSDEYHALSHSGDSNAAAWQKFSNVNRWYAEKISGFLAMLDSIPEAGGTLLDNTLVVWGNEIGKGNNHSHKNTPFVLFGGSGPAFGGRLKTGRYLRYNRDLPSGEHGILHNDLLIAIANLMGLGLGSFGQGSTGPLRGLLTA